MDLQGVYTLVRVAKGKEWKIAFWSPFSRYHYLVRPFWLSKAATSFLHYIDDDIQELQETSALRSLTTVWFAWNQLKNAVSKFAGCFQQWKELGFSSSERNSSPKSKKPSKRELFNPRMVSQWSWPSWVGSKNGPRQSQWREYKRFWVSQPSTGDSFSGTVKESPHS